MDEALILQNHVAEVRRDKGLSQQDLARLVGVSRNTISSIETGQYTPTAKLALLLCVALDKKFEDLFYFQFKTSFKNQCCYPLTTLFYL